MSLLNDTLAAIESVDDKVIEEATERQNDLTKPPGSLGQVETIGIKLAGIAGAVPPPAPERATIGVFAGDHGVCAQGVTPWPQEVTVQMLMNMSAGGAAINVLGRTFGADVVITDVGVASDYPSDAPNIRHKNVRRGTADFSQEPAMTREEAIAAIEVGIETANEVIDGGSQALLTGEMGIGNTSPSTALIAAFTGVDVADATGRGTGADDAMLRHKVTVIRGALEKHEIDTRKLETVQRRIIERTGVYAPFAQHGGTGSAGVAKGLIGKTNINTAFLVAGSQGRYEFFDSQPDEVRGGGKNACGTNVETHVYLEAVYNEAVSRLEPTGSMGIGPACFEALGW